MSQVELLNFIEYGNSSTYAAINNTVLWNVAPMQKIIYMIDGNNI
ncbi:MAG: hypothetical protein WBA23_20025 [Tunicatimonas sp.]